ncbi:MAG: bacillithiol biosynthesis deacetylase BshB1 [Thermincolia bacterium]
MSEQIDIIAFGAHPDDVEIGCGGLLAKEARLGYKTAIVDLTKGEMSTNGTVEERQAESLEAMGILGAAWRQNIEIPDGGIAVNDEYVARVVKVLRTYRPKLILAPYWEDRHPDHAAASRLIQEAHFAAGLCKLMPELPPFRPVEVLYYFLHQDVEPDFVVDVSMVYEIKKAAIMAHQSQFGRQNQMLPTLLSDGFPNFLESRNLYYGAKIKTLHAEGFVVKNWLEVRDPLDFWVAKEV